MTPIRRRSSRLESLKPNWNHRDTLQIGVSSSNFLATSTPKHTAARITATTTKCQYRSQITDSTFRPDSPASNSSTASLKFQRDLQQEFRKIKTLSYCASYRVTIKIAGLVREMNLYNP